MAENTGDEQTWPTAVPAGEGVTPKPGDIVIDPELPYAPEPLVGDGAANPLEDEEAGAVPEIPLLAMKEHRHTQWSAILGLGQHMPLRLEIGDGQSAVYAIDDGKHHAVLGRVVAASSAATYCLVGRITMDELQSLIDETIPTTAAFEAAQELCLFGIATVASVASTNVFEVERYATFGEVPDAYRVGTPVATLAHDLDIDVN
jgi:hypothetical protein